MGMKFLNKKGWHTGSLRNIENVWKAEQKHDAEQKKLEELRKQILEERERSEFRLLQEQAGLVPRQERLEFLYDSGLAVGKGSSDGFKGLETLPKAHPEAASSSSAKHPQPQQPSVPGALFEEKPQSANDTWRKLHSDPLLLIRQREQEALARVKNNPVQMAMIRKSVEAKKHKDKTSDGEEHQNKPHRRKSKHRKHSSPKHGSDLENDNDEEAEGERRSTNSRKSFKHDEHRSEELRERDFQRTKDADTCPNYKKQRHSEPSEPNAEQSEDKDRNERNHDKSKREKYHTEDGTRYESSRRGRERNTPDRTSRRELNHKRGNGRVKLSEEGAEPNAEQSEDNDRTKRNHDKSKREKYHLEGRNNHESSRRGLRNSPDRTTSRQELNHKRGNGRVKLSEEERAARLREMQVDAEIHEEQRWTRLKKAEEDDAREASRAGTTSGKNFLDAAQKSVYGAEKGGSSTIEESVRRRAHYSQGRSQVGEGNAFRR